jgi:threonine/homoserine/homoserine lactone efflux protein
MFLKGFKFGLVLQFAVGPICLFIFNTAGTHDFFAGSAAAFAATLVDGLYILLAGLGLCAFLQNPRVAAFVRLGGTAMLILFGLDIILSALGVLLLPAMRIFQGNPTEGVFWKAAAMTSSNPLTIIFWGGVLSVNIVNEGMNRRQLSVFGLGCIAATLLFLHMVSLAGTAMGAFLPETALTVLSVCVGAFIIFFGLCMLRPKKEQPHDSLKKSYSAGIPFQRLNRLLSMPMLSIMRPAMMAARSSMVSGLW